MSSELDEESYYIPPLSEEVTLFPNPRLVSDEGLLAYGGDLSSQRLLHAYKKGIFPWYSKDDPILWWSPNPRLLLYPNKFIVRKSFKRVLRSGKFTITFDKYFSDVIAHCALVDRKSQESSWIVEEMIEAYIRLHEEGLAHSVEVHKEGRLVGGLYGIAYGKVFFGESMFSLVSDASKVAFKALSDVLGSKSYDFIDCQMKTDHMVSMGAEVVERNLFLDLLEESVSKQSDLGKWHDFEWKYNND